jgi:hypothetical protein
LYVIVYPTFVTLGVIVTADAGISNVAFVNDVGLVTVTPFPPASFTVHPLNVYPVSNVAVILTVSSNLYVQSVPVG